MRPLLSSGGASILLLFLFQTAANPAERNARLRDMEPTEPVDYPPEYGYLKLRDNLANIDGDKVLREQLEGEDQTSEFTQRYGTSGTYFTWKFIDDVTYAYTPPAKQDFVIGLLVDPCKGQAPDCCEARFGQAEYRSPVGLRTTNGNVAAISLNQFGDVMPDEYKRLPDTFTKFDSNCKVVIENEGEITERTVVIREEKVLEYGVEVVQRKVVQGIIRDDFFEYVGDLSTTEPICMGHLQAVEVAIFLPVCWDNNSTVVADTKCYSKDGTSQRNCVSVGFTQSAYIFQCNGKHAEDIQCGTFLELHPSVTKIARSEGYSVADRLKEGGGENIGSAGVKFESMDSSISGDAAELSSSLLISQTRLMEGFTSGYRVSTLPTSFMGLKSKTICKGEYEIWMVQRNRYRFEIQARKNLLVESPPCEFDAINNVHETFACDRNEQFEPSKTGSMNAKPPQGFYYTYDPPMRDCVRVDSKPPEPLVR